MTGRIDTQTKPLRIAWWILLAIILGLVAFIRIRLLNLPLERDEGEYAYAGQLMLQGIPPYQLSYNMKFPGTYAAYALLMSIFGQTIAGVHLGLLVVNAATIALVFLLGRRLFSSTAGIAAAATYAVLSVSVSVLGLAGHATHFVVFPVLAGAFLLMRPAHPPSKAVVFGSGVLFGAGLLMKQPAIFFMPFGALYLSYRDWQERLTWKLILLRTVIFATGAILPFGITSLLLWRAGVFGKFWFWTVIYARTYGIFVSVSESHQLFFEEI
jgi:4-amino-4-deoxy-L-arabinose transferase-like glycosyltransferase